MTTKLSSVRIQQLAVGALTAVFSGAIKAVLIPVDTVKLTFGANVTVNQGTPDAKTFTPCDDNGKIKTFANIDDLVTWLKGAYTDINSVDISIADFNLISKAYVPALDVLKDATSKKTFYVKKKLGLVDNLAASNLEVSRAELAGYNLPSAHAASKAIYAEIVAKKEAVLSASDFYTARIAYFQSIITG